MRESIASTWVMQLVIAFVLLFVGFLALMVSFSKTFKAKNEVLKIIEKYEGIPTGGDTVTRMNSYLQGIGYTSLGKCESGWQGTSSLGATDLVTTNTTNKYYYCIKKVINASYETAYYELVMFYSFNLPIVGKFATFEVKGSTIDLKYW